jgi:hypothetical protein
MSGPLCKVCGKPVPKKTVSHCFGVTDRSGYATLIYHPEKPATRADAQRLINGQIISMKMSWRSEEPRYVASVNAWDGETYEWGGHFHAQGCAARFGWGMAMEFPDRAYPPYREAMAARGESA